MAGAALTRLYSSFKRGHRRSSSESNPITGNCGRASTSSCGSVNSQDWTPSAHEKSGASVKRVIVVVDQSSEARLALLWALSHIVHKLDVVTLLYVSQGKTKFRGEAKGYQVLNTLKDLCLERRPEIEVETLVVEGDKGPMIVGQAKKLEASVLVLGQRKFGFLWRFLRLTGDGLIDYCIQNAECLTLAVRRKSKKVGGYLINSKWQKNFWLLA
ncbi:uncharacterized protein LOC9630379 [Selaginella moellendorffii]|uniref:uncharacterized protein LOC9642151 n=1 Tax=Selaginella moellendorffii TaxID=88036 RepID=UPI000D1C9135|nr:uncharacterized protein LOC9642151 [Selaginella moellendorffii]XP_024536299.1 uncharacterized protein LOC9630379 [Selaginella moellendorffii]|eukprot:XP_024534284.1 uncharacterized protein LOC9642151 [Selaginella moellendorffii]